MKIEKFKILFMIILSLCIAVSGFSQSSDKKEKIEALRVAFITNKLELSSKEAQVFWPLYNEYLDKAENLKNQRRKELKSGSTLPENISDKELESLLASEFSIREKEVQLNKEYFEKFKLVLPLKKVVQLYKAEDEFKKELLRQLSGK